MLPAREIKKKLNWIELNFGGNPTLEKFDLRKDPRNTALT